MMDKVLFILSFLILPFSLFAQVTAPSLQGRAGGESSYTTTTPMVHDPVMAYEDGTYYLFSTGMGVQMMTSTDLETWTGYRRPALQPIEGLTPQPREGRRMRLPQLPAWTADSVPGFRGHVWAPDIIRYRDRWWMAYSCSTFGRNTSAIGLASTPTLNLRDTVNYQWRDHGCLVASREKRDNWNAIDPAFIIDDAGNPWLTWGSFWDGIQMAPLDSTMHIAAGVQPKTIARRVALRDTLRAEPNPTSKFAGRNAIEAPFIFRHGDYYYLFVSHDYCCRGIESNYKVVVGRSTKVDGPYLDRTGRDMADGGGNLFIQGDHKVFEATGHSAAYHLPDGRDLFICHGYSYKHSGQAILIQREIHWTEDGWPELPSRIDSDE